jgi:hypothetical protein
MASRKKKKEEGKAPNINGHGQVDARARALGDMRKSRGRKPGDGGGVDIGIQPGAFIGLERHLKTLKPATRARMATHIRDHVNEAMKPLLKLVERNGNDHELLLLRDVGPNMLRTVLESLEDKHQ